MHLVVTHAYCTFIVPGQTPAEERPVFSDVLGKVAQRFYEPPIKMRIALVRLVLCVVRIMLIAAADRRAPWQKRVVRGR